MTTDYGLGRLHIPDYRDRSYLMQAVLPAAPSPRTYRYWWPSGWWGDQGASSRCVAFSFEHWVQDGPVTAPGDPTDDDLWAAYRWMQRNDQWPGESPTYEGTSVRAGAKYHVDAGRVAGYRWAWDIGTVVQALLDAGPVVAGTVWRSGMFTPDSGGVIRPTGSDAGGHAYLLNGVNTNTGYIRLKNSWGRGWGRGGYAYISIDDMAGLLADNGEACLPTAV